MTQLELIPKTGHDLWRERWDELMWKTITAGLYFRQLELPL